MSNITFRITPAPAKGFQLVALEGEGETLCALLGHPGVRRLTRYLPEAILNTECYMHAGADDVLVIHRTSVWKPNCHFETFKALLTRLLSSQLSSHNIFFPLSEEDARPELVILLEALEFKCLAPGHYVKLNGNLLD